MGFSNACNVTLRYACHCFVVVARCPKNLRDMAVNPEMAAVEERRVNISLIFWELVLFLRLVGSLHCNVVPDDQQRFTQYMFLPT